MGDVARDTLESWQDGVITAGETDQIPPSSVPLAYNAILGSLGPGKAIFAKRSGFTTVNATPLTGSAPILGLFNFRERTGTDYASMRVVTTDAGEVATIDTLDAVTVVDAAGLTSGTHYPDFAVMNNLCFLCNGVEAKKITGGLLQLWGITRPTVGTLSAIASVTTGNPNGTYELRCTFGNSVTGVESSGSDTATATVTVANKVINVSNIPVSTDPQVDTRYIYIRNTSTMTQFYRALTIANNTATTGAINTLDSALTVIIPGSASNDPPPATITTCAVHKNRMFVATATTLYYSNVGKPEAFNLVSQYEDVNKDDGQKITGLVSINGVLLILKENSTFVLEGETPSTWAIQLVDGRVGCIGPRARTVGAGNVYWWSPLRGPVQWAPGGVVNAIGTDLIGPTIGEDGVNTANMASICVAADDTQQRVLFAVPGVGQARNTIILPFQMKLQRWESDRWDPFDISALGMAEDASQVRRLQLGGYSGQVWQYGADGRDGVESGTHTGTFVASASSISSITDATATFNTTGGGLVERKVTILSSDYQHMTTVRPYITANDATSLTLSTSVSGFAIGETYTYIVGGMDFQMESHTRDLGHPFLKKRFEFAYLATRPQGSAMLVTMLVNAQDGQATSANNTSSASMWDTAVWDDSYWSGLVTIYSKYRIGKTGMSMQMRVRNPYVDEGLAIVKMGCRAELQVDRWQ